MTTRSQVRVRALGAVACALLALGCAPPKLDGFLYDPLAAPAGGYQLSTAVIPATWQDLRIPTPDGKTLQGYFIPSSGARPDVTLIYFHGQSNNVGTTWPRLEYLYPLGCNILAVDVRGYGLSTGSPDEPGIDLDVRAIWDAATGGAPRNPATAQPAATVDAGHVMIYGRSLGAAFATQLAYAVSTALPPTPPAVLVTESAFTSVAALVDDGAYVDLPRSFVARSSWDNLTKIRAVRSAYLAFHGTADSYVLTRYSQELFAAHNAVFPAVKTDLVLVDGADHDDVPEVLTLPAYQDHLRGYLDAIPAAAATATLAP
jgi:pimeloyl-ACP methyl ester carboxylesterase